MSEFDLTEADLKQEVLKLWECQRCGNITQSWNKNAPKVCMHDADPKTPLFACLGQEFKEVVKVKTVPVTTGYHTEIVFDNIDSIDDDSNQFAENQENNKDLEKLEKARR